MRGDVAFLIDCDGCMHSLYTAAMEGLKVQKNTSNPPSEEEINTALLNQALVKFMLEKVKEAEKTTIFSASTRQDLLVEKLNAEKPAYSPINHRFFIQTLLVLEKYLKEIHEAKTIVLDKTLMPDIHHSLEFGTTFTGIKSYCDAKDEETKNEIWDGQKSVIFSDKGKFTLIYTFIQKLANDRTDPQIPLDVYFFDDTVDILKPLYQIFSKNAELFIPENINLHFCRYAPTDDESVNETDYPIIIGKGETNKQYKQTTHGLINFLASKPANSLVPKQFLDSCLCYLKRYNNTGKLIINNNAPSKRFFDTLVFRANIILKNSPTNDRDNTLSEKEQKTLDVFCKHIATCFKKSREHYKAGHEKAGLAAAQLGADLADNIYEYFTKPKLERTPGKTQFANNCKASIKKAKPTLKKHRGWKQTFANIAQSLTIIGIFIGDFRTDKGKSYAFGFFHCKTESEKMLDNIQADVRHCKDA